MHTRIRIVCKCYKKNNCKTIFIHDLSMLMEQSQILICNRERKCDEFQMNFS